MLVVTPSVSPRMAVVADAGKANPYPEYVIGCVRMNPGLLHDGRGPT